MSPAPPPARDARRILLRDPAPEDFGWIVARNVALYAQEYGWTGPFEGVCETIVADFVRDFDAEKERCWIAEVDGVRAGSVMVVKDTPEVARIRLLLLEPAARGLGLGGRLVDACIRFARERGYRRMVLWTHQELTAARAIYAKAGFVQTGSETHDDWGKVAVSEFWEMEL